MDSRLSPNPSLLAVAYTALSSFSEMVTRGVLESTAASRAKYPAAMSSCSASFYNSTSRPFTTVPKYDAWRLHDLGVINLVPDRALDDEDLVADLRDKGADVDVVDGGDFGGDRCSVDVGRGTRQRGRWQ